MMAAMCSISLTCGFSSIVGDSKLEVPLMRKILVFVVCWGIIFFPRPLEMTDVKFVTTTSNFNPKYVSNFTISIGEDPHSLNLDVILLADVISDFYALVDVQIKLKDSKRYQSLFTEDFDVCELVDNMARGNLMKKWYRNLLRYGNFMENCPVPQGHYFLRGLLVDQASLAMYLRPGDYRIVARGYFKKPDEQNETVVGAMIDVKWV